MQPGYPGSGQDPYGQQPPYTDPYAQPQYQPQYPQPPADPTAPPTAPTGQQPEQPPQYQDPYASQASGAPYPGPGYPGANPYSMAGYGAPTGAPPQQSNTQGLLALIFGIVSIPGVCCSIVGLGLGIAAVVLGRIGMKKAETGQATNRGQALAGLICGAIGAVLSIVSIILALVLHINNFNFPTSP